MGKSLAEQTAAELLTYPPEVLAKLRYERDLWLRPEQFPPDWSLYNTWLLMPGRAWGKSLAASFAVRDLVENHGVKHVVFVGRTARETIDYMVKGPTGILSVFPEETRPVYVASQSRVVFHTGAVALLRASEKPDAIRGGNIELCWIDELASFGPNLEEVMLQLTLASREGEPKKIITTTPRPHPYLKRLVAEAAERRIFVTRGSSFDNFANLPEDTRREFRELAKIGIGQQEVWGEFWEPEGAIFKPDWFQYLPQAPAGGRVVIGVDPSTTKDGDETGIVVAKRVGDLAYVIEDLSGHHSADTWPRLVAEAAKRHKAACIVVETNKGREWVAALIRPHDRTTQIKEVYSIRDKADRSIPVAALYERKKVFHCPKHVKLEEQMTAWNPRVLQERGVKRLNKSPDRMDAAIFALSELGMHLSLATYGPPPGPILPSRI